MSKNDATGTNKTPEELLIEQADLKIDQILGITTYLTEKTKVAKESNESSITGKIEISVQQEKELSVYNFLYVLEVIKQICNRFGTLVRGKYFTFVGGKFEFVILLNKT